MNIIKFKPPFQFSNVDFVTDLKEMKRKNIRIYNTLLFAHKDLKSAWKCQPKLKIGCWNWGKEVISHYVNLTQVSQCPSIEDIIKEIKPKKLSKEIILERWSKAKELVKQKTRISPVDWFLKELDSKKRKLIQKKVQETISQLNIPHKKLIDDRIINLQSVRDFEKNNRCTYDEHLFAEEYICFLYIPTMREKYPWGEAFFSVLPEGIRKFQKELILSA